MKKLGVTVGVVAGALCLTAATVNAGVNAEAQAAQAVLVTVTAAELPAAVSSFIASKPAAEQTDAAVGAMKVAMKLNASAAGVVLASIASTAPATVAQATLVAVDALPSQRDYLIKVAVKNAPAYARVIAATLAKAQPKNAKDIAKVIADMVPSEAASIYAIADSGANTTVNRIPGAAIESGRSLAFASDSTTVGAPFQNTPASTSINSSTTQSSSTTQRSYAGHGSN